MQLIETLSRMWIECDPNRGGGIDSGGSPDDRITLHEDGKVRQAKRWEWFTPRAEATLTFLDEHGLQIVPKPGWRPAALRPKPNKAKFLKGKKKG